MKFRSTIVLIGVMGFWLFAQSCFQFRKSDRSQLKTIAEAQQQSKLGVVKTKGRNMHYTWVGDSITQDTAEKPLVVFVHGSPGSSSNFLHFVKDTNLTNNFDVLLVDRPGFGYSNFGRSEPDLERQSAMIREVIKQFKYNDIVLVGHSLGGPIICRMAMNDTTLYSGLVVVAGSIAPELEPEENWRSTLDKKWLRWVLPTSFRVSNQEILPAKEQLDLMVPLWPRIKIPVRFLHGTKDNLVAVENVDFGKKVLVNCEVNCQILEGDNHFIPFDDPQLVVQEILASRR